MTTSVVPFNLTDKQINIIKDTICKGATDEELQLFLHVCQKSGLDPLLKQIYSIKRGNQRTIQTSIDGLRLIAERTGKYSPGRETTYTYDDKRRVLSATAYVKKMTPDGTWHETASTAFMSEYNQGMGLWQRLPHVMLGKCAEANALRRAFPAEMCGLYSDEEMHQADAVEEKKEPQPVKEEKKEKKQADPVIGKAEIKYIKDQIETKEDEVFLQEVLDKAKVTSLSKFPQKWYPDLCSRLEKRKGGAE